MATNSAQTARIGRLFIISGPAGAGKGTILEQVRLRRPDLALSVSATTRAPRPGEIEGISYYFMSETEFRERIDRGEFLEWATVHGNLYGTLISEVEDRLGSGSLILELDVQGALTVRTLLPGSVLVFIEPPSIDELRHRMEQRGSETEEMLARRLSDAEAEMQAAPLYDEIVVNDDLNRAIHDVLAIMERYECTSAS